MATAKPITRHLTGIVTSSHLMSKAVKVRIPTQTWNKRVRKFFPSSKTYLVSDPTSALVEGDVVRIASGWRTSRNIRHVVESIVAPFGKPVESRPRVLSEEERVRERERARLEKDVRRAEAGKWASVRRVDEARARGVEVPSLEFAMRHVREREREEAERAASGRGGKKKGGDGAVSKRERRVVERAATKAESQQSPGTPNVEVSKDGVTS